MTGTIPHTLPPRPKFTRDDLPWALTYCDSRIAELRADADRLASDPLRWEERRDLLAKAKAYDTTKDILQGIV